MYVDNDGKIFNVSHSSWFHLHTSECRNLLSANITNIKNTDQNTTDTIHIVSMTSYSPADIRKMVDDLDDAIRTSVDNGDVEKAFEKKRAIMVRNLFFESPLSLKTS